MPIIKKRKNISKEINFWPSGLFLQIERDLNFNWLDMSIGLTGKL